ncbi:MAG: prepilin-type N-terminal cleavage/methylation domain-containing protein [Terriglobales bacterium]|jgi:prepilin-type N-terminal cleavage/methylation domain-containing protein
MAKQIKLRSHRPKEHGFTLIEMMIACVVFLIGSVAMLSLFFVGVQRTVGHGDQGTRCTEYAQDKVEQLMAIPFANTTYDTTVYPTCTSSCTCPEGLSAGGGVTSGSPVTCYVDYGDGNGNFSTTATGAVYTRQWMVANDSNTPTQIKTITVLVTPPKNISAPSTMLVVQKESF